MVDTRPVPWQQEHVSRPLPPQREQKGIVPSFEQVKNAESRFVLFRGTRAAARSCYFHATTAVAHFPPARTKKDEEI